MCKTRLAKTEKKIKAQSAFSKSSQFSSFFQEEDNHI